MAKSNALTEWLGIPPAEQPPNHYRLLALPLFETDRAKIDAAAEDAMARVRAAAGRERMELAGKVLTMLKSARTCLLNDAVRKQYDAQLRESLGLSAGAAEPPVPVIDTGKAATAVDRARRKKRSPVPMIAAAAVAGAALAGGLVFSGVIPLFKKPAQEQKQNVAKDEPSETEKSPPTDQDAKRNPVAPKVAKIDPPQQPAAKPVFLTELTPHETKVDAPGFQFKVNQRHPQHGLWLHPVKGGSGRVAYKLGRKYRWLQGVAVVPDSSKETRDITIRLIGDGRVLWESHTLRKRGDWQQFTVDVADVDELAVVSRTASGNYVYAHVGLVEPKLLVDPAKPAALQIAGVTDGGRDVGKTSPAAVTSTAAAALDVTDLKQATPLSQFGQWKDLPEYLQGASYFEAPKGAKLTLRGNEVGFTVAKPGVVVMLASWHYDGNRNGGWYATRSTADSLKRDGWILLGKTTVFRQHDQEHSIYARAFKAGDKVRLHTRKYVRPLIVSLDGKQAGKIIAMLGSAGRKVARGVPSTQAVDLLKQIDPKRDAVHGLWTLENGVLSTTGSDVSQLIITNNAPNEYELLLRVRRLKGSRPASWLGLALTGGGSQFWAFLDTPKDWTSGLALLDGRKGHINEITRRREPLLKLDRDSNIVCRVDRAGVTVSVDATRIVEWRGDFSRLSPHPSFRKRSEKQLGIGSFGPIAIRKVELRPLNAAVAPGRALLALPTAAAQQKSLALIKDVFKTEYAAATKPQQKGALAAKLLAQAGKTANDETARYVLLHEAQRLATEARDVTTVLQAVDQIAAKFAIDALAEKTDVLRRLSASARGVVQVKAVADATFELAKSAADAKQFDASLQLLKLAGSTAGKARLRTLARSIGDFRSLVLARQKSFAAAEAAAITLQSKPDDPEANLVRGRYVCFILRDWDAGLPLLARGNNATLKKLAERELSAPSDPKDIVALADAWYDAALKSGRDTVTKTAMAVRAVAWYREAEPAVTGLYKTKVEKQLAEISRRKLIPEGTAIDKLLRINTIPAVQTPNKSAAGQTPVYVWEIISKPWTPAKNNLRVEFLPDGTTNHGHKWKIDARKFVAGWDSGGLLVGDGTLARGRWYRGWFFTARLLMKNARLKSEPAPKAVLSKTAGQTPVGRFPIGDLRTTMVDCWELTAQTRGARNLIRLSVDFTADGQVIDAGRKIATWEAAGRNVLVKFLDEKLGTVTFGKRSGNRLAGVSKAEGQPPWTCQLDRVQLVAVYKSETLGTLTFYSNGRVNRPRHETSSTDMHWNFEKTFLYVDAYSSDVSADGKSLPDIDAKFVSGRPLVLPR